jgi:uncharacterized damage-inducible protein DinB
MGKTSRRFDEITLMRAWCDWNSRSRGEYLDALLRLSPEERRKERGASWGSIQDIFLHVIEDYIWWFEKVPQGKLAEFEPLVGRDLSERELRRLTRRVGRSVGAVMGSLKPSDLRRPLEVSGKSGDGKPYKFTTCLADIIWHMLEEELQHRGELNALFWQMDIDPPVRSWFSSAGSVSKN